ncbi:MAG: hypothetical protein ACJAZC_000209 [Cryomorphaceae bacterium]|jgi:hypothetical protein
MNVIPLAILIFISTTIYSQENEWGGIPGLDESRIDFFGLNHFY